MPGSPNPPPAWMIDGIGGGLGALLSAVLRRARDARGVLFDLPSMIERTAAEYAELLGRKGFRRTRLVPTAGPMSVVEALPG